MEGTIFKLQLQPVSDLHDRAAVLEGESLLIDFSFLLFKRPIRSFKSSRNLEGLHLHDIALGNSGTRDRFRGWGRRDIGESPP